MKKANVFVNGILAGELQEIERNKKYLFVYANAYNGPSVSLEMPTSKFIYEFDRFPPFFEGLLQQAKLDRNDFMSQIITVGKDLVGNVTVEAQS
jgi:serine/threonine-protein kinase HipA